MGFTTRSDPKVVVLGVGNILRRDEGVGVRVIQYLQDRYAFPGNVTLVDGGTAGLGLLSLIEGADHLIVVDAVQAGEAPGSLFVFTPDELSFQTAPQLSLHEIGLVEVLALLKAVGRRRPRTVIIGVQPEDISLWEPELTPTVRAQVPKLAALVLQELARLGVEATLTQRVPEV